MFRLVWLLVFIIPISGCSSHPTYYKHAICYKKPLDKKGKTKLCWIKNGRWGIGIIIEML